MVPGDSFATRTLLPDDEIMKRLKPDEEDMAKGLAASMNLHNKPDESISPGGTTQIKKIKNNDKPVFN